MSERNELEMYYDFYGSLLTEQQNLVMKLWLEEDYSLSEISQEVGASRQAAHDMIKRSSEKLREYEDKMKLLKLFEKQRAIVQELQTELAPLKNSDPLRYESILSKLEEILY